MDPKKDSKAGGKEKPEVDGRVDKKSKEKMGNQENAKVESKKSSKVDKTAKEKMDEEENTKVDNKKNSKVDKTAKEKMDEEENTKVDNKKNSKVDKKSKKKMDEEENAKVDNKEKPKVDDKATKKVDKKGSKKGGDSGDHEDAADTNVKSAGTGKEQEISKGELKLRKALHSEIGYFNKKLRVSVAKPGVSVESLEARLEHITLKTAGRFAKTRVKDVDDELRSRYEGKLKKHMKKAGNRAVGKIANPHVSDALKALSSASYDQSDDDDDDDDDESEGTPKTPEEHMDDVLRWTVKVSSVVKEVTSAVGDVVDTVCTAVGDVGQTIKKLKE